MTGGIEPKLPIDVFPLHPIWVIPYVLCYPVCVLGAGWLVWKSEERLFRAAIAGIYFTCALGIAIFLLFPTYVVLPEIARVDYLSKLLLSVMVAGGRYDALPSAHVYITTILAFFYWKWRTDYGWLWFSILLIVSLSTLFTKQHYILDVIGGTVTGWLGYLFGLWWSGRDSRRVRSTHT